MTNIAIIGGGASGLFAAITALSSGTEISVTIFEKLSHFPFFLSSIMT